jgi:hypothetical protein
MARPKKKSSFKDVVRSKLNGTNIKETAHSTPKKAEKQRKVVKVKKPEKVIVAKQQKPKKSEVVICKDESITDLRVIMRSYAKSSIEFETYQYIPSDRQITKLTDVGRRVIVAKYPEFYKIYFMEYVDVGKKHFPNGGIKVYNATHEQTQYFYYDSVALHPSKKDKYRVKNLDV